MTRVGSQCSGILLAVVTKLKLKLGWFRGAVVERRSLTGELSLRCARPTADA